jgi:hypothetical protein
VRNTIARGLGILALAAMAACSSAPAPAVQRDGASGAALTVVGWSLRTQSPIPIRGVVRGAEAPIELDTRSAPAGQTFEGLAPGAYRIEATHRFASDRVIPATGLERVDLRPGERARVEVVVDDREGDDSNQ